MRYVVRKGVSCRSEMMRALVFVFLPRLFWRWTDCPVEGLLLHVSSSSTRLQTGRIAHNTGLPSHGKSADQPFDEATNKSLLLGRPIDPAGWPMKFPAKEHCSKCGLCESTFVQHVRNACAFLEDGMSLMDRLEPIVHDGKSRDIQSNWDELRFGIQYEPIQLVRGKNMDGAQWTGAVTSIALSMLETKKVDAVVCVAGGSRDKDDDCGGGAWSIPEPILARTAEQVLRGRGVKPALAPSLRVLDEIQKDKSIRKLLFCGVGCAVQAFRSVQGKLTNLDEIYVLGTNCADNAPTPEAANNFIQTGLGVSLSEKAVKGYEFMPDYLVHAKLEDRASGQSEYLTIPYFSLPASIADPSIAYSCRACFDYTNACADVVIGYMGAPITPGMKMDDDQKAQQTLTIRNRRGADMVQTAVDQDRLWINPEPPLDEGNHEQTTITTVLSDTLVLGLFQKQELKKQPQQGMPRWLGNGIALVLQTVGPEGLAFARYSIDYHILRNFFHVLYQCQGDEAKTYAKLPASAVCIVKQYMARNQAIAELKHKIQQEQAIVISS